MKIYFKICLDLFISTHQSVSIMSLQYPIVIDNEPELCRFIRDIFQQVVKDPYSDLPVFMSQRQCSKVKGISYDMVKSALLKGELKLSVIGGKTGIKRTDFLSWINNETPIRRFRKQ